MFIKKIPSLYKLINEMLCKNISKKLQLNLYSFITIKHTQSKMNLIIIQLPIINQFLG